MEHYDNIELRSEKVRNIIGQIPPRIIRIGTTLFTFIFMILGLFLYSYNFPFKIKTKASLWNANDSIMFSILLPIHQGKNIRNNQEITFKIKDNADIETINFK